MYLQQKSCTLFFVANWIKKNREILTALKYIGNRNEKWGKKYTSRRLQRRSYGL